MKAIHLISGLPRSGSTLLCNLLAQNQRFQCAGTSGLVDLLLLMRNSWDQLQEFRAMPPEESAAAKLRVMRGMLFNYHPKGGGIIFDKSRSWLPHIEMVEALLGCPVKVIVPVRDVREILASLELLWRKHKPLSLFPAEAQDREAFETLAGRCNFWASTKGWLGKAYARILDAEARGLEDRLQFVSYEFLTSYPADALTVVSDFLEEDWFPYNFSNAAPIIQEDDRAYGIPGLHTIRPKVEPVPSRWKEVLGDVGIPYGQSNAALGNPAKE